MEEIAKIVFANSWLLLLAVILIAVLLPLTVVLISKAYREGREISIFGLKIGKRITEDKTLQQIKSEP